MTSSVPVWTLGDRLRKARHLAGLHQRDLAEYLGLSAAAIGMYEMDVRSPKLGMLRGWATRCEVSLDWLRYGDTGPAADTSTTWYLTAQAA
jgi:transcriptional regulator with XRE-family HTH domain